MLWTRYYDWLKLKVSDAVHNLLRDSVSRERVNMTRHNLYDSCDLRLCTCDLETWHQKVSGVATVLMHFKPYLGGLSDKQSHVFVDEPLSWLLALPIIDASVLDDLVRRFGLCALKDGARGYYLVYDAYEYLEVFVTGTNMRNGRLSSRPLYFKLEYKHRFFPVFYFGDGAWKSDDGYSEWGAFERVCRILQDCGGLSDFYPTCMQQFATIEDAKNWAYLELDSLYLPN